MACSNPKETYKPLCPLLSVKVCSAPQPVCMADNCAWYVPSYRTSGFGVTVPGGCALQRLAVTLDKMYREV